MDRKPIVSWKPPDTFPVVEKGETETFWLAVKYKRKDDWHQIVFDAQYVNKPLEYSEEDLNHEYPLDDDCFTDLDGYPIEAVGWYNTLYHPEFNNYYEPISFHKDCKLLGWAEYHKPEFTR